MQQFDITLKSLLLQSKPRVVKELAGSGVVRWITTELPKVQNLQVDLLADTENGELVQIEWQRKQDANFAFRMLEYSVAITRVHGRVPRQIAFYIGIEPLRMPDIYKWAYGSARFTLVDTRELDGDALIESLDFGDNVISILGRLKDPQRAIRKVVKRISRLPRDKADEFISMLGTLAGLRGLEGTLKQEVKYAMDLDMDELIPQNEFFAPIYRKGVEEGRQEGERSLLQRQIRHRFGALPQWAEQRFASLSRAELDEVADRILSVSSLEQLFPAQ